MQLVVVVVHSGMDSETNISHINISACARGLQYLCVCVSVCLLPL